MSSRLVPLAYRSLLAACAGLLACTTGITGNEGLGNRQGPGGPSSLAEERPAPSGRFARLTHEQWENSVRDLLLLSETSGLSSTFPADARTAGFLFDNHELSLETDQVLSNAYANAAETLATSISTNPTALSRLVPANAANREGARTFISSFGERTFRRPLTTGEVDRFLQLYDAGLSLYDDATGFQAGIRLVIEAFLQSPHFLYRVEASTRAIAGSIPLSNWEVGQRLSYLVTNSTPDAELLRAARAGELSTPKAVRDQALRLLGSPKARPALVHFHDQLLEFEKFEGINPSARVYPGLPATFATDILGSSRLFVEDLAFNEAGSFEDLMTSTQAFVNDGLASVYRANGSFNRSFVKVNLPESERRGILNQVGFLAANSTSVHPDPIHRGVFIATRVLCLGIAAPPDGVPPLPPVTQGTNRQVVANHTESSPTCRACHQNLINPFGFPFENYDASGAYRTTDNGFPVDAKTAPFIDGEQVEVDNSLELAEALSQSPQAHECFVSHLLEYAFGRARTKVDEGLIDNLTQASLEGTPITELLVRMAESGAFTSRSTEELP